MGLIESNVVMTALKDHYPFTITDCTLFGQYFHDNYVINTNNGKYFVRVYKGGVRDQSEILFEIDFINHLRHNEFSISFPIPRNVKYLSGGERVRFQLAQMIANEVTILILDEPTNHLDIPAREVLEEGLKNFKGTIIMVSHDRYFIRSVCTKVYLLENKQLKMM